MRQAMARAVFWMLPPACLFGMVLLVWHLTTVVLDLPPFLLPSPVRVLSAAVTHAPVLVIATGLTAAAALCGFAASFLAGLAISFIFSQSRVVQRSAYPYAIFLQTVPIVAIAPLIITWFGTGFQSVVIVTFIVSLFPIITNGTMGLSTVDAHLLELFALHNATRWQTLFKLRLPHAVPYLASAAKTSSGLSVIGAIVGEFFAGHSAEHHGLGYLIIVSSSQLKTPLLFAVIFCSTLLGLLIFGATSWVGAAVFARWQPTAVPIHEEST